MRTVGTFEAKTHLSQLLEEVAKGERIVITRHGTPVAMLVPSEDSDRRHVKPTVEAILAFRRGRSLGGMSIAAMVREGRRR